jgi:ABC-type Fe3+/spermidine/putrescine transport system ATPase subunit
VEGSVTRLDGTGPYATVTTSDNVDIRVMRDNLSHNQRVTLAIRPEHITLRQSEAGQVPPGVNRLEGEVVRSAYLGDVMDCRIQVGTWMLRVHTDTDTQLRPNQRVELLIPAEQITLIAAD